MKTSRVVFLAIAGVIAVLLFMLGAATWAKFNENNYKDFSASFDFALLTVFKIFVGALTTALIVSPLVVVVKLIMIADDKQKQENREKEEMMKKWQEVMSKENRE